jgi:DNA-binding NarL/FixJ family response regulator
MKSQSKIMLVEDHAGYREVITRALKREADLELISQFGTAEIALRGLQNPAEKDRPDIVLLDLNLPGMSGIEAMPWFKKYAPQSNIIILTQSDKKDDVLRAIALGARGYLLKSATVQQITEGIRTVAEGGASLDPEMAVYLLNTLHGRPVEAEKALSDREQEVLSLLGDGLVKKEIAERLDISTTTVAYHVKHIYEKLEVQNAPAAVAKAYRTGIFS